jgi:hypothetical protein
VTLFVSAPLHLDDAPGQWRYEDGWPIARVRERVLYPRPDGALAEEAPAPATATLRYVPTTGVEAGGPVMWWGDVAPDQRPTDAFSLVYETAPLEKDVEILGLPKALLRVAADAPHADWFARLNDVAPDGTVTLVTGAGQNGAATIGRKLSSVRAFCRFLVKRGVLEGNPAAAIAAIPGLSIKTPTFG